MTRRAVASQPIDPGLIRLIEALARAQARKDHAAALADMQKRQDRPNAHSSDIRPVLV